jgi:hypothetical protein
MFGPFMSLGTRIPKERIRMGTQSGTSWSRPSGLVQADPHTGFPSMLRSFIHSTSRMDYRQESGGNAAMRKPRASTHLDYHLSTPALPSGARKASPARTGSSVTFWRMPRQGGSERPRSCAAQDASGLGARALSEHCPSRADSRGDAGPGPVRVHGASEPLRRQVPGPPRRRPAMTRIIAATRTRTENLKPGTRTLSDW